MPRQLTYIIVLILSVFLPCQLLSAPKNADKKFTVVIDAGHGGKDIGASDNGVMEKNINLKVAKQLENLIKKKMKDVKVVMTRDDDTYLTLQERADKANKSQGDLFISIHTNSVDKKNRNRKTVAGSSVYTLGLHKDENNLQVAMRENSVIELENDYEQKYSGFDPQRDESYIIFEMAQKKNLSQSIKFAENVEKELVASGRQDRGVHQAGFWVLWATSMPSVLIELDFICNPESAKYMTSDKGVKELAQSIFNAVEKYASSSSSVSIGAEILKEEEIPVEEIAIVTTRKKKEATGIISLSNNPQNKNIEAGRKRRSLASRNKSMQLSFENEKLTLPSVKKSGVEAFESTESSSLIANADIDRTSSANDKKAKKAKEKSEKQARKAQNKQKKDKSSSHNAKVNKLVTVYKIQVLASADLLSQGNSRFCGLSPISAYKENNLYKYYYGESTDLQEVEMMLADVKKKIPDAFIVTSTKSIQTK